MQPADTLRIWDERFEISLATRAVVFRWLSKSLITPTGGSRSGTRGSIYPTSKYWRQDPNLQPDRFEQEMKAGFVDLFYFRGRLIAFVAFRRGRFWCETGAVRHQANRTVGSNPTLSANTLSAIGRTHPKIAEKSA